MLLRALLLILYLEMMHLELSKSEEDIMIFFTLGNPYAKDGQAFIYLPSPKRKLTL